MADPKPIDPINPIVNQNPITEIRKKVDGALVIEQTPKNPVTKTTTHNIAELQAEITKYQNVIAAWQSKIDPLQAIVDEYSALVEEATPEPEPMEEGI